MTTSELEFINMQNEKAMIGDCQMDDDNITRIANELYDDVTKNKELIQIINSLNSRYEDIKDECSSARIDELFSDEDMLLAKIRPKQIMLDLRSKYPNIKFSYEVVCFIDFDINFDINNDNYLIMGYMRLLKDYVCFDISLNANSKTIYSDRTYIDISNGITKRRLLNKWVKLIDSCFNKLE